MEIQNYTLIEKQEIKELIEDKSRKSDLNISFLTNREVKDDIIGQNHNVPDLPILEEATEADIDEIFNSVKKYL